MTGSARRIPLACWLLALALSIWQLAHTRVTSDLTGFLPASVSQQQRLLMEQLRSGAASRLVLIAVEGAAADALAAISKALVARLRTLPIFASVRNGEFTELQADLDVIMRHRYVLSPTTDAERFSSSGLHEALESGLHQLASANGVVLREILPRDPTGELARIAEKYAVAAPAKRADVWFSRDGRRALLVAETVAGGFDVTRQAEALDAIRASFDAVAKDPSARILLSGSGVFTVASRATIEREAWLLAAVSGILVLLVLYRVYRSPWIVALCTLPAASGLLVGTAAVGAGFGSIHAITLGFGATLIGEAVDYPSYVCAHAGPGESVGATLQRIWPTLRLAVLTTAFGAIAMLLSSFAGLSQLGLLSMTGILTAGLVTRWVLPALAGSRAITSTGFTLPARVEGVCDQIGRFGPLAYALALVAAVFLIARADRLWDDDLSNMNPVPESLRKADRDLRSELGAPDVRHLLVLKGPDRESVLQRSEESEPWLDELVQRRVIAGYELASRYLPSAITQARRIAALPPPELLRANLETALRGLPYQQGVFEPFLRDAEASRVRGALRFDDLRNSAVELKLRSLLTRSGADWIALVPVQGVAHSEQLATEVGRRAKPYLSLLDIKAESDALLAGYRSETMHLIGICLVAIVLVLGWGLRRVDAVVGVLAPVLASLVISVALLQIAGHRLAIFHLIALLLVLGIGLNYSLFFQRRAMDPAMRTRTLLSLLVCGLTTVLAFGTLAWSSTAVLHAIGLTVTIGATAALFVAAACARGRSA